MRDQAEQARYSLAAGHSLVAYVSVRMKSDEGPQVPGPQVGPAGLYWRLDSEVADVLILFLEGLIVAAHG